MTGQSVEFLEGRVLMAAVNAVLSEDLSVIHADRQRINLDVEQIHAVARLDRNSAAAMNRTDETRIQDDESQLRHDERFAVQNVPADYTQLETDEADLRADLRTELGTSRAHRVMLLAQLRMDKGTLKVDKKTYARDRQERL